MIRAYIYWIAAGDRAFGEGDAQHIEALRVLWRTHRMVDAVSAFDGASFWVADGQPRARVIRTVPATAAHPQVVDVDPALLLPRGRPAHDPGRGTKDAWRFAMDSVRAINISEEIARLRESAALHHKAHIAATIVKEQDLRAVLVVMAKGANLHPHQPDESVVLQVLDGSVRVHSPGGIVVAAAGTILTLGAGVLHDVEAVQNSAFLLVLPWPTRRAGVPMTGDRVALESDVDEALQDSMPASDPPSWTQMHAGAPRR